MLVWALTVSSLAGCFGGGGGQSFWSKVLLEFLALVRGLFCVVVRDLPLDVSLPFSLALSSVLLKSLSLLAMSASVTVDVELDSALVRSPLLLSGVARPWA